MKRGVSLSTDTEHTKPTLSQNPRVISESAEFEDMNESGKEAYHQRKQRNRRIHSIIAITGGIATGVGLISGPIWLVVGVAFAAASLGELLSSRPDMDAIIAGRLAEHSPPEQLSWEEHVRKYGKRDGEPLTEEEVEGLLNS